MEAVECKTQEEWDFVSKILKYDWQDGEWDNYKEKSIIDLEDLTFGILEDFKKENYKIYTFQEWLKKK